MQTYIAEGAVGSYRAGLNLTVRDRDQVVAAHYYYASAGTDIPLTVTRAKGQIVLTEPGGARMTLALTNPDAREPRPLIFFTATGLAGDWSKADKVLPVRFGFATVRSGPSPARWYRDVTSQSDTAFEARCRQFIVSVIRGDRTGAAAAASYPVRVNGPVRLTLRSRAELLAQWSRIFTPAAIARLREAIPHEMFVRDGMAMVANGTVWFDQGGAKVLNLP